MSRMAERLKKEQDKWMAGGGDKNALSENDGIRLNREFYDWLRDIDA